MMGRPRCLEPRTPGLRTGHRAAGGAHGARGARGGATGGSGHGGGSQGVGEDARGEI